MRFAHRPVALAKSDRTFSLCNYAAIHVGERHQLLRTGKPVVRDGRHVPAAAIGVLQGRETSAHGYFS